MKTKLFHIASAATLLWLTSCSTPQLSQERGQGNALIAPNTQLAPTQEVDTNSDAQVPLNLNVAGATLSQSEAEALLFMREEEKLARDVYQTLYAKWKLQPFTNIARSEQTHTDAIRRLMDAYKVTDTSSTQVGVFTNPDLQKLYSSLVAQGEKSVVDALKVGATIEDLDIVDLQTRKAQTNKADIQVVYDSLIRGSENHLRAFTGQLANYGSGYKPQYLSQSAYDAIVAANQRGGPRR